MPATAIQRVLLVDDEPLILRVAQMSLQKSRSWQVLLARSGQDALATAIQERPDIILLDAMMPGLDGLATLRLLRRHSVTNVIPVILFTAHPVAERADEFRRHGAVGVLGKPFDPATLASQVEAIFASV